VLELHFQKSLGLANDHDVIIAGNAIDCLWQDGWGMVSQEAAGASPANAFYSKGVFDIMPDPNFLMYTTLERLDPNSEEGTLNHIYQNWKQLPKGKRTDIMTHFTKAKSRVISRTERQMVKMYDKIDKHVDENSIVSHTA